VIHQFNDVFFDVVDCCEAVEHAIAQFIAQTGCSLDQLALVIDQHAGKRRRRNDGLAKLLLKLRHLRRHRRKRRAFGRSCAMRAGTGRLCCASVTRVSRLDGACASGFDGACASRLDGTSTGRFDRACASRLDGAKAGGFYSTWQSRLGFSRLRRFIWRAVLTFRRGRVSVLFSHG
jgi:hypothetical protein